MRKKLYSYLLAIGGIIFLWSCQNSDKQSASIFQQINTEVDANSKAYEAIKEASKKIGHRLTGSENGRKSEEYVYKLFKKYGFEQVEYQPFEVESWMRGDVELKIGRDKNSLRNYNVVTLGHSPVSAFVNAPIVDVGSGLKKDFNLKKDQLEGKIALAYIGLLPGDEKEENLHRSEKAELAIEYGAKGIIIINKVKNRVLLTGTASVDGALISIPAVCITYEDGMALKEQMMEEKLMASIEMTNHSKMIKARNVVATLQGSEFPDEKIIVGAHLDSWDLATGAIDNGIGVFSVLDIARTFKALKISPKRTIQFVLYMGEEQGLFGSKHMVKLLKKRNKLDQIKYVMNIDMAGNPIGFNAYGREKALTFFEELGEDIKKSVHNFPNKNENEITLHSDHQPFLLEGIPVVEPVSNLDPIIYDCYHADCDDIKLVNNNHLKNTVRFCSMLIYELSNTTEIPAKKLDSETNRTFLIDNRMKEKLIMAGEWYWDHDDEKQEILTSIGK